MNIRTTKLIDYYVGVLLIAFLKPFVFLLGKLRPRDHNLEIRKDVTFVKLLGGGSLVIALPSLLGLRKRYPDLNINIVTTKAVTPFARTLNVFDNYYEIDHSNVFRLIVTSVSVFIKTFRCDTIVDFEVHSRLTTAFSVLTAARNRMGFYRHDAFWRRPIYTHIVFFNIFSGSYEFYDKVLQLFSVVPSSIDECKEALLELLPKTEKPEHYRICIGHACSDLGRERMLDAEQWEKVFQDKIDDTLQGEVIFLGAQRDSMLASEIIEHVSSRFKNITFVNSCGKYSLSESLSVLSSSDEYWGIDSSLLHYARFFKIKVVSFWGPTDPKTRLREIPELDEEVYYSKIPCSPCTHITETPPCLGDNICIQNMFSDSKRDWIGMIK